MSIKILILNCPSVNINKYEKNLIVKSKTHIIKFKNIK